MCRKIVLLIIFIYSFAFAESGMQFDIGTGHIKQIHLSFEPIKNQLVNNIYDNIKNNLKTTSLFLSFDSPDNVFDTIEDKINISQSLLNEKIVDKYTRSDIDATITGYLTTTNGKNELTIKLFDVLDQRELFTKSYQVDETNWRRNADIIADVIYEHLTAEITGHFDSKILFVLESGTLKERKKKIAVMDFNGSNLTYLTDGNNLVLTPIFSKYDKDEIIYLEYANNTPNLVKINSKYRTKMRIGDADEMTFAPNFNTNGKNEMIYSISKNGNTNIYKINFDTKKTSKLTSDNAINTVSTYSPDGEKILFMSDKSGVRKLYIMDSDGGTANQISKGTGAYDKPSWSPDGRLISFVKIEGGKFYVGLMTPDGENERLPISAYLIEGIKWSPNGRYLIYSKQKGAFGKDSIASLYTYDILTGNEYKLPTPENQGATDPDWIKK